MIVGRFLSTINIALCLSTFQKMKQICWQSMIMIFISKLLTHLGFHDYAREWDDRLTLSRTPSFWGKAWAQLTQAQLTLSGVIGARGDGAARPSPLFICPNK